MDLSAILNDVQDDEGAPFKGEAEATRITETRHGPSRLLRLPAALHDPIISHLTNRDIKSLRLTCTFFHDIARLRLHRVFISAHHRDVQVLRAIADSDAFRSGVTELIWDDARLSNFPHLAQAHDENVKDNNSETHDNNDSEVPKWFVDACNGNIDDLNSRKGLDADRPEHAAQAEQLNTRLPAAACWAHYRELLQQQDAVLSSGADEAAFRYALQQFPSLERVTITPAAHGWLFSPLYETPTIRTLPNGFNYPIPRGWPTAPDGCPPHSMRPWPGDGEGEAYKDQWRGVRLALRVLAEPQTEHSVTEFVLDAHHLDTGLNCRIFEHPAAQASAEYTNLCALLRRPGFARLGLALAVGGQEHLGWPALRGGHLRAALEGAPDLRHFSLRTNVVPDPDARALVRGSGGNAEHHVPLGILWPVESWTRLRHFGLSGFLVTQEDVISLLRALPGSLRSVGLSFLHFVDNGGDWRGLLGEMRDTLDWREREAACRPDVVVGHALIVPRCGRAVWADREAVGSFLYGDGPNPFGDEGEPAPNQIVMGNGAGVERDALDPSHERPYVDNFELMRLGLVKKAPWLERDV
ncbi:hypothetical protein INS49_013640 [Diaporthe citri]|uniref:uncharacterized protein n=1 Tax=Diaporthe citri TaxID=83186 RepID=UPI001C7FBCA5|nr:uncharacterized protein INS49_013640 [Diaporthe citri]KAG6357761.1 hypothetical protein INS49_013640 [Diaporthe citri]